MIADGELHPSGSEGAWWLTHQAHLKNLHQRAAAVPPQNRMIDVDCVSLRSISNMSTEKRHDVFSIFFTEHCLSMLHWCGAQRDPACQSSHSGATDHSEATTTILMQQNAPIVPASSCSPPNASLLVVQRRQESSNNNRTQHIQLYQHEHARQLTTNGSNYF